MEKENAVTGSESDSEPEALVETLSHLPNDIGQWVESILQLENIGSKKVRKTANSLNQRLRKVPDSTQTNRSNVDAPLTFLCPRIRSIGKNLIGSGWLLAFDRKVVLLCMT